MHLRFEHLIPERFRQQNVLVEDPFSAQHQQDPARITTVNEDGTYNVKFIFDGRLQQGVLAHLIASGDDLRSSRTSRTAKKPTDSSSSSQAQPQAAAEQEEERLPVEVVFLDDLEHNLHVAHKYEKQSVCSNGACRPSVVVDWTALQQDLNLMCTNVMNEYAPVNQVVCCIHLA